MKLLTFAALSCLCLLTATATADPRGGARTGTGYAAPESTREIDLTLVGREVTAFQVRGDGDGDLDCVLYDGAFNQVDSDMSAADACYLSVEPRWTGTFHLTITNNGNESTIYTYRIW